MLIARGDRIETDSDGSASFLFADESTFAVAGDARAIFEDLVFDPDSTAAHATFVVQEGTFSFSGGGIAATDGAFAIKTPSATLHVGGASGSGRLEGDGGTMVTYLRADDVGDGAIRVSNPAGTQILDRAYEVTTVDDYFSVPSNIFRLGPRDAVEHFGDALAPLPDALAKMPESLLSTARGADPASRAVTAEAEENGFAEERDLSLGLKAISRLTVKQHLKSQLVKRLLRARLAMQQMKHWVMRHLQKMQRASRRRMQATLLMLNNKTLITYAQKLCRFFRNLKSGMMHLKVPFIRLKLHSS